ncbi:MAG: hypothetical protein IPP31_11675 [Chitinophagaceae bacterium]|nr:hypothetical protein [Chitinophagaceae bacterium]
MKYSIAMIFGFCFCFLSVFSQNEENRPATKYDPHALFSPLVYPGGSNITRAATGSPMRLTGRTGLITRSPHPSGRKHMK